jgi:hypothetical protein
MLAQDPSKTEIMRQPWPLHSKNGFSISMPEENPGRFLFLKPNPFVDAMIAQVSLKKYFSFNFWRILPS